MAVSLFVGLMRDLYIPKKIKITAVSSVFTEQPLLTINIVSIASEVYQN